MKKFLFTLAILAIASLAYAAPKWVPTVYIGDQLIKSGAAIIVDANIYFKGVTVGDMVQLKNGTTSSGTTFFTFVAPTANGTYQLPRLKKDLMVDTGIYLDQTISGGYMNVELIYQ